MEALRYVLNAREDFDRIRSALARDSPASDVQRAAWFYQLIRYSYASGLTSFGSQPHDMRSNFSLIEQAHRRLAKVVIENKDFEKLLHQYDRPVSFFYLDPPYHATEGYYQNIGEDGFTEADHIRLRDALMRIEGKFLLSYNDARLCPRAVRQARHLPHGNHPYQQHQAEVRQWGSVPGTAYRQL